MTPDPITTLRLIEAHREAVAYRDWSRRRRDLAPYPEIAIEYQALADRWAAAVDSTAEKLAQRLAGGFEHDGTGYAMVEGEVVATPKKVRANEIEGFDTP